MKITRKTRISIKTERKFYERQTPSDEPIFCGRCAEPMISAQMSAHFFGLSSREIYRLVETGEIHFVETAANEIYVCPLSVKEILRQVGSRSLSASSTESETNRITK